MIFPFQYEILFMGAYFAVIGTFVKLFFPHLPPLAFSLHMMVIFSAVMASAILIPSTAAEIIPPA